MRIKLAGNLGDKVVVNVKNAEASSSIPNGTPVVAVLNATSDGLAVVLPSTAGSALSFMGKLGVYVGAASLAPTYTGDCIAYGYVAYALITRMTRAASTDSWSSSSSVASGVVMGIDTLNNAFVLGASSAGSLPSLAFAMLVDSLASSAASASATSDTRTAITNGARAFVRCL